MSGTGHPTPRRDEPSRLRRTFRRGVVVVAVPVAGVLVAGTAAVAFWTATGTGTGSAQSGTMTAPVVEAGAVSGTALYPGLSANGSSTGGDLAVKVTNPNAFAVVVTLTQNGQPTACATPSVTLLTSPALTVSVPAGATVSKTFTRVVSMGTGASDDCQGKTLSIPLTSSSQSS